MDNQAHRALICREYAERIIEGNQRLYDEWLKRRELALEVTDPQELSRLGFIRKEYDE